MEKEETEKKESLEGIQERDGGGGKESRNKTDEHTALGKRKQFNWKRGDIEKNKKNYIV